MPRPRKTRIKIRSLEDANKQLGELRDVTLQLEALLVDQATATAKAQASYEFDIDNARFTKTDIEQALQAYYYDHLDELEKDGARSVKLANGIIGRRTNPPALKPLNRSWTWQKIKDAVRAQFGKKYFHLPKDPEIDKDALKAANLAASDLKDLGLKVEQGEEFYATPEPLPEMP